MDPTYPIWVLFLVFTAWKSYLLSTDLALITFQRFDDIIIFYFMSYTGSCEKMPACLNFSALFLPTELGSQCTAHQP